MEKPKKYQFTAEPGDIVKMPCGTLALVTQYDILNSGHNKELTLYPFTNILHRAFLVLAGRSRPVDDDINKLTKVGSIATV